MISRATKPRSRALLGLAALCALTPPADAQTRQVFGYAGVLGEWELTATVARGGAPADDEFFGPLTMTHVGMCTQDGPLQRIGHIRFRLSSRLNAILSIGGVTCTFTGSLSDAYKGVLGCADQEPVPLSLWID